MKRSLMMLMAVSALVSTSAFAQADLAKAKNCMLRVRRLLRIRRRLGHDLGQDRDLVEGWGVGHDWPATKWVSGYDCLR